MPARPVPCHPGAVLRPRALLLGPAVQMWRRLQADPSLPLRFAAVRALGMTACIQSSRGRSPAEGSASGPRCADVATTASRSLAPFRTIHSRDVASQPLRGGGGACARASHAAHQLMRTPDLPGMKLGQSRTARGFGRAPRRRPVTPAPRAQPFCAGQCHRQGPASAGCACPS